MFIYTFYTTHCTWWNLQTFNKWRCHPSPHSDKCGMGEEAQSCELAFIVWHNSPLTPEVSGASHLSKSHAQLAMNRHSGESSLRSIAKHWNGFQVTKVRIKSRRKWQMSSLPQGSFPVLLFWPVLSMFSNSLCGLKVCNNTFLSLRRNFNENGTQVAEWVGGRMRC